MEVQEDFISFIIKGLLKEHLQDLIFFGRTKIELEKIQKPFKKIRYDKIVEILRDYGVEFKWGNDLGWKEEKILTKNLKQPFFITHFPKGIKAFYHKPDPDNPSVTLSADLLAPEGYGEITGGGERIADLAELLKRIQESKLNAKDYEWYIDLRRYGSLPHAGFGLGLERILSWICKLKHIRETIAFPRLINRIYP